jgi:hypothetical protein
MKKAIIAGVCLLALGASFVGGVLWEYAAERQGIADIETAAVEACQIQLKTARRLCK